MNIFKIFTAINYSPYGIKDHLAPLSYSRSKNSQYLYQSLMAIIEVTAQSHFPIKLTATNFPVWRKQVISTLIGLGLDHFIDGSQEAPSKTLSTDATKPNPEYRPWYRQDQILLGALLSSCSETIQPIVSSADTSRQVFKRLNDSYASVSRSRIIDPLPFVNFVIFQVTTLKTAGNLPDS